VFRVSTVSNKTYITMITWTCFFRLWSNKKSTIITGFYKNTFEKTKISFQCEIIFFFKFLLFIIISFIWIKNLIPIKCLSRQIILWLKFNRRSRIISWFNHWIRWQFWIGFGWVLFWISTFISLLIKTKMNCFIIFDKYNCNVFDLLIYKEKSNLFFFYLIY